MMHMCRLHCLACCLVGEVVECAKSLLSNLLRGSAAAFCCLTDWEAGEEQNMSLELLCPLVFPHMYLDINRLLNLIIACFCVE